MNTLKPLLTVAVLAGIGYGVYVRINDGSDAPPPPGVASAWDAPKVRMGDAVAPGGTAPWGPGGGAPTAAPAGGSLAGPPAGSSIPAPADPRGAEAAPPYASSAPGTGASPFGPSDPLSTAQAPQAAPPYAGAPVGAPSADPVPPVPGPPPSSVPVDPYANVAPPPPSAAPPSASPFEANASAPAPATPAAAGPPGPAAISVSPVGENAVVMNYAAVMEVAKRDLEAGQLASALKHLSSCYGDPHLAPAEHAQLTQLLDQVAGTVVYSTQHLLEPPYEVQPGERLEDIAQKYNVPWQLLAKINGIDDPQNLRAGERLKVLRGPFSAVVSLATRQLLLMTSDGSYAGRFNIGIGGEHPPREGAFTVADKLVNPVYHGRGRAIGADDPANPLGERWIGLGGEMAIHGTDRAENIGRTDLPGSISLSPRDVEDVFDILSVGSTVTIRR